MDNKTYLDFYRERVFRTGSSAQERASNSLNSDFMQLVKTSPNSVEIEYQGLKYQCILNSGNSRVGAQTERKVIQYLLTDLDLKLPEGAVFTMHQSLESETTTWLVLHREIHSFYGYYKFKIIELDYQLNYVDKNGIVKTVPAYINGTGEFDIKAYFRYSLNNIIETPNRALNVIWAANDDIQTDLRILIGDEAWKVVDSDKISIKGVYYTTLYKTTRNVLTDDVSAQLADANEVTATKIVSNYGNPITIAQGAEDLQFYCLREGKVVNGDILARVSTTEIGTSTVNVVDNATKTVEPFVVNVVESVTDPYCFAIGDARMSVEDTIQWTINSNVELTVQKNDLCKLTLQDGILKIKSALQIGHTEIVLEYNDQKWTFPLEIQSMWVN